MKKVLVILAAFNNQRYLAACLAPWLRLKRAHPGKIFISAVSVPFLSFDSTVFDSTQPMLKDYRSLGSIDALVTAKDATFTEAEARNLALDNAKTSKGFVFDYDFLFVLDGDEVYRDDLAPLEAMFEQAENEPAECFKVPFTNITFAPDLAQNHMLWSNRIWRKPEDERKTVLRFGDDNGIDVCNAISGAKLYEDRSKPIGKISMENVAVDHFTWLNDLTSKRKISYQRARWGFCSFQWDQAAGLQFDASYYADRGEKVPDVVPLHSIQRGKHLHDTQP